MSPSLGKKISPVPKVHFVCCPLSVKGQALQHNCSFTLSTLFPHSLLPARILHSVAQSCQGKDQKCFAAVSPGTQPSATFSDRSFFEPVFFFTCLFQGTPFLNAHAKLFLELPVVCPGLADPFLCQTATCWRARMMLCSCI